MASAAAMDTMPDALRQSRYHMKRCFARFTGKGRRLMKLQHLQEEIEQTIEDKVERFKVMEGTIGDILSSTQEAAVVPPYVAFAVRHNPGIWDYVKVEADSLSVDLINISPSLQMIFVGASTNYVLFQRANDENSLEIDFGAFDTGTPKLALPSSIGNGLGYISKFMTSVLGGKTESAKPLIDYLLTLERNGEVRETENRFEPAY